MGKKIFGKKDKTPKNPDMQKRSLLSRFDLLNRFKHWYLGGIGLTRSMFRVKAAWQGVGIIVAILTVMYIMAAFYTQSGEFVINIDKTMANDGFYISDTPDFSEKLKSALFGKSANE